jgi:hypothetical protein
MDTNPIIHERGQLKPELLLCMNLNLHAVFSEIKSYGLQHQQ